MFVCLFFIKDDKSLATSLSNFFNGAFSGAHFAEQDAAFHLGLLLRLHQRHHDGVGRHREILHHRVGDVLHQSALLLERASPERIDDHFRHPVLLKATPAAIIAAGRRRDSSCRGSSDAHPGNLPSVSTVASPCWTSPSCRPSGSRTTASSRP